MHSKLFKISKVLMLSLILVFPSIGWSNAVDEVPSPVAMTGDALFVRPAMMAVTLIGSVIFIVSSPFSALGGNIGDSFDQLVGKPFNTTFIRCLGCTMTGRKVSTTIKQTEEPIEK